MKERPEGFLAEDKIDHDGEIFDYIKELHDYLWGFIRVEFPNASGTLDDFIDDALLVARARITSKIEIQWDSTNERGEGEYDD